MSYFFHQALYRPLFNLLILFYQTAAFQDLGVAIILLTFGIRLLLFPLFYKSFRSQTILQRLQPHVKRIQEEHKGNREKQGRAMMELYKEHKVNPFSSFLLILIQLPILIALYQVFLNNSPESLSDLYFFVKAPLVIHRTFLGLIDLSKHSIIIVVLAAFAQYFQGKLSLTKAKGTVQKSADRIGRQMIFIAPILTIVILQSLPAAVGLYWLATSLFSLAQQMIINRSLDTRDELNRKSPKPGEDVNRNDRPQ